MHSERAKRASLALVCASALAATAVMCGQAQAAPVPFTAGNLVVTRAVGGAVDTSGGQGSVGAVTTGNTLQGNGVAASVVIDEYTPAGVLVQTVPLPNVRRTSGSGNAALTFSGTQNTEGAITLSGDGRYFVVAGYNATAVFNNVIGTSPDFLATSGGASTSVERTVGLIDMNGNVNTTTALNDVSSGQPFRSAYSSDGTSIWTSGGSGSTTTGGIKYTTVGSATSTQLVAGNTNHRVLNYNSLTNSLLVSINAQTVGTRGPNQLSGNLATTGPQTLTQLPGFNLVAAPTPTGQNTDDFWFKDAVTLYIADERAGATGSGNGAGENGGVQKWLFEDTNADTILDAWVFKYNVPLGTQAGPTVGGNVGGHGLAGTIDPSSGNAVLYVTTFDGSAANQDRLYKLVDPGTQAGFASSLTLLATSPLNGTFATAFRGVEIVPAVPEPGSIALLGLGSLAMLRRRKTV